MMSVQPICRNLICLLSIILASSLSFSLSFAGTIEGKVVSVADGDTVTVLDSNKVQHRVRLAGIDAPEKGQPYGNASRKKLRDLVSGKEVKIEYEKHDRYGRIVGKAWITPPDCPACGKTLDVGLAQITTGMAWWFRRYAHEQSPEDQGEVQVCRTGSKGEEGRAVAGQEPDTAVGVQASAKVIIPFDPAHFSFHIFRITLTKWAGIYPIQQIVAGIIYYLFSFNSVKIYKTPICLAKKLLDF